MSQCFRPVKEIWNTHSSCFVEPKAPITLLHARLVLALIRDTPRSGELLPQCERVLAGLAKCAGRQSSGLRCLDLAADIIEKRSRYFLTPDMARRSSQRFAASFCIDGKQFVHLSADNSVFAVIRTLQHRPRLSNRCVGQTLTIKA